MNATAVSTAITDRPAGVPSLGFLTVLREANGFVGGYLIVNGWGRPLEFRLTSAVQPNRVQQILYGGTLDSYVCADLIGKTLVDKAGVAAQLVITDREEVLDLRLKLDVPVVWLSSADAAAARPQSARVAQGAGARNPLLCHPRFAGDAAAVGDMLDGMGGDLDLADPFQRIRDAIGEARKMGVASR